jgi:hypothetical protein
VGWIRPLRRKEAQGKVGRGVAAVHVVLDIGVEPLKSRIQVGRQAEEKDVALKGRQVEHPGQYLQRRRGTCLVHGLRLPGQFLFHLGDSLGGGRFLGIFQVETGFSLAILAGQQPVGLGVADDQ